MWLVERKRKMFENRKHLEGALTMKINRHLFYALWDKAVGTPGYDKKQWQELEAQINDANKKLA